MKWTVRRAVPADAGRIAEINIEGWRAAYRGLLPDSYLDGMRYETLRERWSTGLRSYTEPAAMFVAVGPDPVVRAYAFVSAARQETDRHPNLPTGELCAIYADPRWRGTGAGFAVHQAALGHLAAHGYRHAVLWVLAGNALRGGSTRRGAGSATTCCRTCRWAESRFRRCGTRGGFRRAGRS